MQGCQMEELMHNYKEQGEHMKKNQKKQITFKNCAPFINCICKKNNKQIDNAKDIDVAVPMYNLIKYTDNYSKTSGSLWHYYRDMSGEGDDAAIKDSDSFKSKIKITGKTPAAGNRRMLK